MSQYGAPVDIINRALQILEVPRIQTLMDFSPGAIEAGFLYDKIRRAMLRRHVWTFATRRAALRPVATTTVLLSPAMWTADIYEAGSIVSYQGVLYIALVENAGGTPGQPSSGWEQYFGPLTVTPWNIPTPTPPLLQAIDVNPYLPQTPVGVGITPYGAGPGTVGYHTGELTYLPKGDGTYLVFRATLTTANRPPNIPSSTVQPAGTNAPNGPLLADPWDAGITYAQGQLAAFPPLGLWLLGISAGTEVLGAQVYQSTVDLNIGNQPDLVQSDALLTWNSTNPYSVGDHAWGSDSQVYQCLVANTGQNPVTDQLFAYWLPMTMWVGTWTNIVSPSPRAFSNGWQYIAGTLSTMPINYPITSGPVDDTLTLNAYKLPANCLREAPSDPKHGNIGWLGAPSGGVWYDDRELEGGFIVTQDTKPIIYRFVADITDVFAMDDLFCEAFAASIARAAQPILQTGRIDLFQRAKDIHDETMDDALKINAIEAGSVEPPVDDLLTCRL